MIEYLIDIKGLTYTEILNDSVTEEKVIKEMTSWYEGQINIFDESICETKCLK